VRTRTLLFLPLIEAHRDCCSTAPYVHPSARPSKYRSNHQIMSGGRRRGRVGFRDPARPGDPCARARPCAYRTWILAHGRRALILDDRRATTSVAPVSVAGDGDKAGEEMVLLWNAKDVRLHAALRDPDILCRARECTRGQALEPRLGAAPMPDRDGRRATTQRRRTIHVAG
jgi:hypothetical protein